MAYIKCRFKTYSKDYKPLIYNPKYPYWCTGHGEDYSIFIAYLPIGASLFQYWDDAFDIEAIITESIEFTDRFPRPNWFINYKTIIYDKN